MLDSYKREITYLRISVTDRCNLRCKYCMPAEGIELKKHEDILRFGQIIEVVRIAADLGITKVRITGGEPLVRKGIVDLVAEIASIPKITELGMTTNGIELKHFAYDLKQAGLQRVNISLDTIDKKKYSELTRGGDISKVFEGIDAAKNAGLFPIKINSVIFNQDDKETKNDLISFAQTNGLQIRFIHQMNLHTGNFSVIEGGTRGNCKICNRLRLTSDGFVKPCLFSEIAYNIKEFGIREAIINAITTKPEKGSFCTNHEFYNIGG